MMTKHFGAVLLALLPGIAFANDASAGDTAWILTSTALVLFMTLPGLALFYGGLVRARNVLSVLMQCFAICGVVTLLWVAFGYSLAFTEGGPLLGDLSKAFMSGVGMDSLTGTIPEPLFAMFQLTFAVITPALIVGGFAERMRFSAMLLFSAVWLVVVYIPVTHWVWGGGWLGQMGLLDFAGGTVVHITAGVAALVAAVMLGSREGFPRTPMLPHNMTMTVTGAGMLWVGWFGFNGGSALAANGQAAMALFVTHISAAAGSLAWVACERIRFGKPSALGIVTGMVAGLGTITPASGYVGPGGAILIGLIAGFVCFNATQYIKQVLKIDDSLDVFPVHGVGGIIGTLMAALFCAPTLGVFSGHGFAEGITSIGGQLKVQAIGVGATLVYSGVLTWGVLKLVGLLLPLRVTAEDEAQGLDITEHDERGYDL